MTMCSSPDSTSPASEENIVGSPETLPPGFECAYTSSPLENPSSSLPPPPSPSPQEQANPTHRPPSPPSSPPQNIQILHSPLENRSPIPDPIPPSPSQERRISLNPSFPPPKQENLDPVTHSALQPLESEGPLQLPHGNLSSPHRSPTQSLPEMGQMVCGNCSELLSYPRGSKYIQCGCCQTTNYVLEAYQVGIVNCAKCFLLLMYPYAAKFLRCSSCQYVTEIGELVMRRCIDSGKNFGVCTSWTIPHASSIQYLYSHNLGCSPVASTSQAFFPQPSSSNVSYVFKLFSRTT